MTDLTAIFTTHNVRKIWKQLRDSEVPIVSNEEYAKIADTVEELLSGLITRRYMPSIGHGILGYPKRAGCTRFVPILTKEDMTVYYIITFALQDYLVHDLEGVYGGWRSIPKKAKKKEEETPEVVDPYFSNSFSKASWFKDWSSFNDLLIDLTGIKKVGNFVITTDVANFYDTIDINILTNRLQAEAGEHLDLIELLRVVLQFWDRRMKGYQPSSKGIPQEIISDASRLLSHFYLKMFDYEFKEYCDTLGLTYVRWADDIIIFGQSQKILEVAVHKASRILLRSGLNLNASKTQHYTKSQFRMYRGLDVLTAVNEKEVKSFGKALRKFVLYSRSNSSRLDTVFRTSLRFMKNKKEARTTFTKHFIEEESKNFLQVGNLSDNLLLAKVAISDNPPKEVKQSMDVILRYPYAAPRAQLIRFFRRYSSDLVKMGISLNVQKSAITRIKKEHGDSEIVQTICVPRALEALEKKLAATTAKLKGKTGKTVKPTAGPTAASGPTAT